MFDRKLLQPSAGNTKLRKSEEDQFRIFSLSLAHAKLSGHEVCAERTTCAASCVGGTGLAAVWQSILEARIARTQFYFADRKGFRKQLYAEIEHEMRRAEENGETLCLRLNTFSDLDFRQVFADFPNVIGYDYSKIHKRAYQESPLNYSVTYSWSENPRHQTACRDILANGLANVAVAFAQRTPPNKPDGYFVGNRALLQRIPSFHALDWIGEEFVTVDGDISDLRFQDPQQTVDGKGRIVALRLKSSTIKQRNAAMKTGFCQVIN